MSMAERGAYITILCFMADKGPMSMDQIKLITGLETLPSALQTKFKVNQDGFLYNERLLSEISKRKSFCASRRTNRMSNICQTSVPHMENENENENENKVNKRFTPPTFAEVTVYCRERNNGINAQLFIDFYSSKDWMIGKNRMKDWKAAIRNWENRNKQAPVASGPREEYKMPKPVSPEERKKVSDLISQTARAFSV